ncbi:MAG TPA: VWA domain-containing protein [Spongiibacteraceae bacterium]|nr:VWA domain-containing protein [Spongiibacteraceae bacterium]
MNAFARFTRACLIPLLSLAASGVNSAPSTGVVLHPDVRVLIDVSGSMKQNDPHNLRKPALELLLQLFPKDARAGIWTFGSTVQTLAPLQNVSDSWRNAAQKKSVQITSTELYTNIPSALEKAAADLDSRPAGYRTSIILLTDGMVDVAKSAAENAAARQRLLKEVLPRLTKAGVVVQTIALSRSADRELMERIAADTGGLFATAETAEELNRIFLQAFDAAAPAEQLPLTGNRFQVDSSIDEITTLVFNKSDKPVELIAPDTKHYSFASHGDDIKWFQGQGYELITAKKPLVGEWTVVADVDKGSRVTIVSNLSLTATRLPDSLFVGAAKDELVAALKQQNEVISQAEFLKLVSFTATVQRREDNKQWPVVLAASDPVDGYYRTPLSMLREPGSYDIAVTVDGKTFQRSQRQTVTVRDNFGVRVAATEAGHGVTLVAQNPKIDVAASSVKAQIKTADGKTSEQPVSVSGDREWLLKLAAGAQSGRVEVSFEATGKYREGEPFTYHSPTVTVDEKGNQEVAVAPKVEATPASEQQPASEPKKEAEPAAAEPAKEPAAEPEKAEAPAESKMDWKKWLLYGGLVLGNILILGLGYFAYRMIMGGGKSKVLEESDDEEGEDNKASGGSAKDDKKGADKKGEPKAKRAGKGSLDLPDDAIDIDPAADKKK